MFYILHGDNAFEQAEVFAALISKAGLPADLLEFNTETLTAPFTIAEFRQACSTIPFMGEARIVTIREGLSKDKGKLAEEIVTYLPDLPPTTHLIFMDSQKLGAKNAVLKLAQQTGATVKLCQLPSSRDLSGWIQQRTRHHRGTIEPAASAVLAQNIGPNLYLLDQEIQKLLLYCGDRKTISLEDVQVMVPYIQSADVIFNLVDAIGRRNPRGAAQYLHRLLDVGEHPLGIFGMVVRQFRLLIQVHWLNEQRYSESEIASRLKIHPFVAKKVREQASQFTAEQLRLAYRMLLENDLAIKQGEIPADAALDLLVAQLTRL
ncbi:MAG: DNA polymerase III subunit delta [Anaerolineae bacterium]|nr:DNA polymerase III subunit delta [Anaerolineae bacterium]